MPQILDFRSRWFVMALPQRFVLGHQALHQPGYSRNGSQEVGPVPGTLVLWHAPRRRGSIVAIVGVSANVCIADGGRAIATGTPPAGCVEPVGDCDSVWDRI